jgi:hypothetical protein
MGAPTREAEWREAGDKGKRDNAQNNEKGGGINDNDGGSHTGAAPGNREISVRSGDGSRQPDSQPNANSNSGPPSRDSQPASKPAGQPDRRKQRQQLQPAEPASQPENTREGPVPPQHSTDERNAQGSPEPARRGAAHPRTIPRADEE